MKLVAAMIVSSDAMFLRYSLPALRRNVDHVVVVEGCDQRWVAKGNANPDGSSVDGTAQIIKNEILRTDNDLAPITYIAPQIYKHRNDQRQRCLNEIRRVGGDVCLVVDADEFYLSESFAKIRECFSSTNIICARWPFFNFYTFVRRFPNISPMERCFRVRDDMSYPDVGSGQYIVLNDGSKIWDDTRVIEGVACYHYNRVFDGEKLINKMRFYFERDCGLGVNLPIPSGMLSEEDRMAILKMRSGGVFVPLDEQPVLARMLPFTSIAPMTSISSLADIFGINIPMDYGDGSCISLADLLVGGSEIKINKIIGMDENYTKNIGKISTKQMLDLIVVWCSENSIREEKSAVVSISFEKVFDCYGDLFFLKEIVRDSFERGDFDFGINLIYQKYKEGPVPEWGHVLEARARARRGDVPGALRCWKNVLEINSNNKEAIEFISGVKLQ